MNVQKSIKDREDSLKEAYQKVLEVGLGNRSIDDLSSFIEHNVMGYGTARDEKIRSITEFVELIQLQRKQSINFDDFHYTSKPVLIRFTDNSYTAVVVDEIELVSVIGNDSNKLDLRMTSVFNFIDGAWKLIHWHGSTAEHVSDGEDPWHVNEWKKKTEKLEQMVEEKTVELIEKNKELEIEASLERVRAVAMGMNKSDDLLSICEISYKEFRKLGFDNIRNALIHIQYDEQKYFMDYDFSDLTGGAITKIEYGSHPVVEDYVKQIRSAKDAFYQGVIKEEQLEEWKNFRRNSGQIDDPRLDKATALYYYFFSIGIGDIGISALEPINESQIKILKRFRNVFDLAYRRYNDIALAEEQARETQIQLALERVRARTMAMQSSNELKEVVLNLFDGLKNLGVDPTVCNISLIDKKTCDSDVWSAHQTDNSLITYRVFISHFEHPFRKKLIDSFLNKISFSVHELSGDLKKSYIQYLIDHVDYSKVPDEVTKSNKKNVNIEEGIVLSAAYMKYGLLIVSRSHAISEDESDILQRFAKIFEQTYTRFLDLQKAEAQAREAQIELALERVRARTMAMQQSDELSETARVLFQQFKELGEDPDQLSIGIVNESEKVIEIWLSLQGNIMNRMFKAPIDEPTVINKIYTAWKEKRKSVIIDISGDELERYHRYVNSDVDYKDYNDVKNRTGREENRRIIYTALFSKGLLSVATHEPRTEETIKILERFAGVFDGTYTRFLDLQKAEAQAKEAQIEVALERVRSQSIGMQSSKDFSNVTTEMFNQLRLFGGDLFATGIVFCDKHDGHVEQWHSLPDAGMLSPFIVPVNLDYIHQYRYDQWKKGVELFEIEIPGDFIEQHFNDIFNLPTAQKVLKDFEDQHTPMPETPPWEIDYGASFKHGYILVSSLQPFKEAEILPRFAKVFEQTYTRFLDLQKAEAQAKEAKIEASMEKIRSRSLAMQKPEELIEVAELLRKEMGYLGVEELETSSIYIVDNENQQAECWYAIKDIREENKRLVSDEMILTLTDTWVGNEMWKFYQSKKEQTSIVMKGDNRKEWINYCANQSQVLQGYYGNEIPERTYHLVKFNGGYMGAASPGDISSESWDLLKRAAAVFSLAYTRFKDLQDAEASAREAQIEAALERVRSRTMGMQKSEELKEVIQIVYDQIVQLKIHTEHTGFIMDYRTRNDYNSWIADRFGTPSQVTIPYFACIYYNRFNEAKEKGLDFFAVTLSFEEKNRFYTDLFQRLPGFPEESKKTIFDAPAFTISTVLLENVALYIENFAGVPYSEEENKILMRFGKVFQQTYTRFLDLQKAEAQAREAQIETALEKVRSRSLAMHKSDELKQVVTVLFERLNELDIPVSAVGISIYIEDSKDLNNYVCGQNETGIAINNYRLSYFDHKIANDFFEVREKGLEFFEGHYSKDEKDSFYEYVIEHSQLKDELPDDIKQFVFQSPFYTISVVATKHAMITINDFEGGSLSDHEIDILKRFSKVFDQAYIRFLDLQKAEAQAREAQIELSMERIRAQVTAMRESSELLDIVVTMRSEFVALGHEAHYFWHMRYLPDKYEKAMTSGDGTRIGMVMTLPRHIHGDIKLIADWEKSNEPTIVFAMDVDTAVGYIEKMISLGDFQQVDPQAPTLDDIRHIGGLTFIMARTTHGEIGYSLPGTIPDPPNESLETLTRFAGVFDLAYKRFEDLKITERQHREAQIELALERTRTQSIMMQHSSELNDISKTFHEQLLSLGIDSEFSFVWLPDEDKHEHLFWATWVNEKNGAAQYQSKAIKYPLDKTEPGTAKCYADWESGQTVHETYVPPDQINSFFAVWEELLRGAEQFKPHLFPEGIYYTEAYMKYGCFGIDIRRKLTADEKEIIRRFAVEFERTYTRFLDLQKAEAQARESRIEAALEKVRSKTMSMQSSDELADTAAVVFQQLINLGIEPNRIYITIITDESGDCEFWITDEDGSKVSSAFNANLNHNNSFQKMYVGWKENKKSISIDMQGKELQDYFKYLSGLNIPFKGGLSQKRRLQYIAYFSKGFIGVASPDETKLETIQLLERFAAVFNLTYTRFNDLKQAEAQNKIIQAENDRKTKELEDARQLQLSMLPKELPKLPHLDIAVYMKTATEVGGDYYDFNIDGNGTLTVVVGDATGHGMMSGMMVSIMKSFFISNRNSINLKEFFENTNNSFKEMHLGRMMMPLIGVQINSEKIIATNAGMPSLLYFRNKSQKAGEFVSNNLPLGGMKGTDYLLKAVRYEKGDTILLMSDGFAELKNSHNEQYGYLRIKEKFRSLVHKSSGEIIEELKTTASHWTNGAEPDDDVTFVVIKFQ